MSPLAEARAHLAKAEEFLQVAELSVGLGHFSAAAGAKKSWHRRSAAGATQAEVL